MGIRCWCPNGHKLNIKAFQAGKRGICPYCGARFTIPLESTRKPGMGDRIPEPMEHSVHEGPVSAPPVGSPGPSSALASPEPPAFLSAPTPLGPVTSAGPASWNPPLEPAPAAPPAPGGQAVPVGQESSLAWGTSPPVSPGFPMGTESVMAAPAEPTGGADPLAEAPNAVWYVRPPTGGQFGPAPADVMRNWIAEGRVSPDSLVWREGWRDWQEAGQVFAQLRGPAILSAAPHSTASRPVKKASSTQNLWLLLVLVAAVAILIGVFIYVAFGPHTTPSSSAPSGSSVSSPATATEK